MLAVASTVALAITVLAGAGIIPPREAFALVVDPLRGQAETGSSILPPPEGRPKVLELRQPGALDAVDDRREGRTIAAAMPKTTKVAAYMSFQLAKAEAARRTATPTGTGPWSTAKVSWYGPGFYGHTMAGGGQLTPTSMVVAHRSLPFGTKIEFSYQGKTCVAVVQDRGPYVAGRIFDLGPGTAKALGFSGVGYVKYRFVR
jgi:rare lipoprotein A (peptidoglycan hydrolase)